MKPGNLLDPKEAEVVYQSLLYLHIFKTKVPTCSKGKTLNDKSERPKLKCLTFPLFIFRRGVFYFCVLFSNYRLNCSIQFCV